MQFWDGTNYKGDFCCNQINGEGILTWKDLSVYKGTFKEGVRNGKGTFTSERKQIKYVGNWLMGKRSGYGELLQPDGSFYKGEFRNGVKHGEGRMTYSSGNYYQGAWTYNKKNGFGIMDWVSDNERYTGVWENDNPNGVGSLVWLDNKGETKVQRNRYSGQFLNGNREGLGVFYYANGSIYEGEFVSNKKHGYAVYTDEVGVITKALFEDDRISKVIETNEIYANSVADQVIKPKTQDLEENAETGLRSYRISSRTLENNAKNRGDIEERPSGLKNKLPTIDLNKLEASNKRNSENVSDGFTGKDHNKRSKSIHNGVAHKGHGNIGNFENEIAKMNPYIRYIEVGDLIGHIPKGKAILDKLCQIFLRHNSSIKSWYKKYSYLSQDLSEGHSNDDIQKSKYDEEGFFMRLSNFWRFLKDTRLCNGKLSIINFNKIFNQGSKNRFQLQFDEAHIKGLLQEVKRLEAEGNLGAEEGKYLVINGSNPKEGFIERFESEKRLNENIHNPDRPILFRHFVDGILRAIYLKNGGFNNFNQIFDEILTNRITPLVNGKMKPRVMIPDEQTILERSKKQVVKNYNKFKTIYDQLVENMQDIAYKTKFLPQKNLMWLLVKTGQLDMEIEEEQYQFWLIVERNDDPDQSVFKSMKKIKLRKVTDPIQKFIRERLLSKSMVELTLEEFIENFMIYFSKKNSLNSKSSSFERKLKNIIEDLCEKMIEEQTIYFEDGKKRHVGFPFSKKDQEKKHIKEIKEKKLKAADLKMQKYKERELEFDERKSMKKFNYDINDKFMRVFNKGKNKISTFSLEKAKLENSMDTHDFYDAESDYYRDSIHDSGKKRPNFEEESDEAGFFMWEGDTNFNRYDK